MGKPKEQDDVQAYLEWEAQWLAAGKPNQWAKPTVKHKRALREPSENQIIEELERYKDREGY